MKGEELTSKYLFVEKYRPSKLEDVVLPEDYRKQIQKYIDDKEIPHLLLIGAPGSGKSTLARILVNHILDSEDDCLLLNGSASTGVDIVRGQIEDFLKCQTFGNSKSKIVFIDEFDYMSQNAQSALRNMMETYNEYGRFLCTANYKSKIIDPLHSRFTTFEFKKLSKDYIVKYCEKILISEDITFNKNFIEKLVSTYYPDVRKTVNALQGKIQGNELNCSFDQLISSEKKIHSYIVDVCHGVKMGKDDMIALSLKNITDTLKEGEVDFLNLYQSLFDDEKLPMWFKVMVNQYSSNHISCLIPNMHFLAMIYSAIRSGKELYNLQLKNVNNYNT